LNCCELYSSSVILNLFQDNRQLHCIIPEPKVGKDKRVRDNARAYIAPKEKAGAAMAAPAPFCLMNSGY
jgi:hypothetical protein